MVGMIIGLHWTSVLAAAVAVFVLGWAWYSPMLFGDAWLRLMKIPKKNIEEQQKKGLKGMWKQLLGNFVSNLVMVAVLAYLFSVVGVVSISAAVGLAFILWLGFFATTGLGMILWENKPWSLYCIHVGYSLSALLLSAIILAILG